MPKNTYLVNDERLIFRRAKETDNFEEIAELIYHTDQYIYPFWFESLDECKKRLKEEIKNPGFIFNYENIYVAYDIDTDKIVGIIAAIDKSVNLDYDYDLLRATNSNYNFTIKNYILPIVDEAKEYDDNIIYISNICVDKNYRGLKIGTKLLGYFIKQLENCGFTEFRLDCLLHNLRAKNLYHSMGFKEVQEIVGFDGTDTSTVEVVSMIRKKGNFIDFPYEIPVNND